MPARGTEVAALFYRLADQIERKRIPGGRYSTDFAVSVATRLQERGTSKVPLPRIVYIHGDQTVHWDCAWLPAVARQLQAAGFETSFQLFPIPSRPAPSTGYLSWSSTYVPA
jgi:hypothetical protein